MMIANRQLTREFLQIKKGDWNGFLTLITSNLAPILILPPILIGAFQLDPALVFGTFLPGLGFSLLVGMGIFTYLAVRLAAAEGQSEVTVLPYGVSTPVMFVYLFGIIGPVYFATNNARLAYQVGLGAAFVGGLVEMSGALFGPLLERVTPRAGILGTVAGISLVWIAVVPGAILFTRPMIGLPVLFIMLLGLVGLYRFPLGLPAGLVAIGLGIILGFFSGVASINIDQLAFYVPVPVLGDLWVGLRALFARPELLTIIIPIEIYNFIGTIGNVESARTAGDNYNTRQCVLLDGLGTCLGAVFGSPFPTTVFIGHPAYKQMGARLNYTPMTGLVLFITGLGGLFAFLQNLIPSAAVAPLLVFVGISMTTYAFRATPAAHGAAVAIAFIPHIADLLKKQLDGTLLEVLPQGSITPDLMANLANNQGVYLQSYDLLARGAIITGLLWGAIVAFLIDQNLRGATLFSFVAFCLSLLGLIHANKIGLSLSPITLGYLLITLLLGLCHLAPSPEAEVPKP